MNQELSANTDDFYYHTDSNVDSVLPLMRDFALQATWHWVPNMLVAQNVSKIESIVLDNLPWLALLKERFGGKLLFYKTPANAMYHWHSDGRVGCALNMVMDEYHCHTLFQLGSHPEDKSSASRVYNLHANRLSTYDSRLTISPLISSCIELQYTPGKFSFFNNQKKHCVVNMGGDRVLVTWIFSRDTVYEEVVEFYIKEIKNKI
jgi:hypothetical protein